MHKITTTFISLQSDFGFKRAFGTERFRSALLLFLDSLLGDEMKVTDVRFHDKEVLPSSESGKRIVYDVYCTMEVPAGESALKQGHLIKSVNMQPVTHHFILEMQNVYEPPFEDRMLYYAAKSIADQGTRGWNYDLDPVILVAVTDFDFPFLKGRMLRDFRVSDRYTNEVLTRKLRMLFLSLRQVPEKWEDCKTHLQRILFLIKNMDKLDKNSAPYVEGGYEKLFEAAESSHMAAEDVVLYSQSLERLNAYRAGIDYAAEQSWASGLEKGRTEGLQKGRAEGLQKGRAEGLQKGRAEGLQKGRAEAEMEIARNMLKAGISKELISSTTGLTIDQIEKLI